jgi:hypothetical protein
MLVHGGILAFDGRLIVPSSDPWIQPSLDSLLRAFPITMVLQ